MALVLDAGGLIGADRKDRRVGALLRVAQRQRIPLRTSGAVVARVWRDGARQANLARVLCGTDVAALGQPVDRRIGQLLARSGTDDIVDGHVALLVSSGDTVLTSDVEDIAHLLRVRDVEATVEGV